MQLDARTSLFFSASIMITISFMMVFYAVSRKENQKFIWLSIAAGFLGVAYTLTYLRGQIPDFFSIIISNELVLFCLIAVYEVFRNFLSVDSKVKLAGFALLVLQFFLLIWFTYYVPDFRTRILIINMSTGIMAVCIIKLMLCNPSKAHRSFHLFSALPFVILFFACMIRIVLYLLKSPVLESSFTSTSYGISLLIYCILLVWISFSTIFITANELQNTLADIALSDSLTGVLNRRGLGDLIYQRPGRIRVTFQ